MLLFFVIIVIFIIGIILFGRFQLAINNIFGTEVKEQEKTENSATIEFIVFNKIPVFRKKLNLFNINSEILNVKLIKDNYRKFKGKYANLSTNEQIKRKTLVKNKIKMLVKYMEIKKIYIDAVIGTENAATTALLCSIIQIIITNIVARRVDFSSHRKFIYKIRRHVFGDVFGDTFQKHVILKQHAFGRCPQKHIKVVPLYNKSYIRVEVNLILSIKLLHIVNMLIKNKE